MRRKTIWMKKSLMTRKMKTMIWKVKRRRME